MASSNGSKLGAHKDVEQMENEQKQQLLLQQTYLQQSSQYIDVRMKRHPELQPYVPSDRDRVLAGNTRRPGQSGGSNMGANGGGSSMTRTNLNHRLAVNKTTKAPVNTNALAAPTNDAKTAKSKKCVSMTRLDQLAQPKKIFPRNTTQQTTSSVPSTSLSSSNATSTTTSSLTSNKNYHQPPKTTSQANRLSASMQSKQATPRVANNSMNNSKSQPKRDIRRPSLDMSQRKSLESRSSFASTTEEETVRLKINGEPEVKQDSTDDEFKVNEVNETRTHYEDQEDSRITRQDEDSKVNEEESRLRLEKERKLKEEEEAKMRADEEARLKADEELREKAKRDEEERQKRQLLVESILSRFTPSS